MKPQSGTGTQNPTVTDIFRILTGATLDKRRAAKTYLPWPRR